MARRQIYIFGGIFACVVALLSVLYFFFLRADYAPLFENMRESDASAIVAELDKEGISYKLGSDGHDILVPEQDIGRARIGLAGSGVALGGVVGFELFNESDMGLTEFAQKINYQRALQGELSRTIMMMEGVEFARVHLALPERSIFRNAQSLPTAAITIQTIGRKDLSPDRVAGIQQLVASSVSDLPIGNVAILDDRGDLLNQVANTSGTDGGAIDERTALEQYFRARAQTVLAQLIPGLRSEVRVFAKNPVVATLKTNTGESKGNETPSTPPSSERNFQLKVVFRTAAALNEEDMGLLRASIIEALKLALDAGDSLDFEVGPLGLAPNGTAPVAFDAANDEAIRSTPPTQYAPRSQLEWMDIIFSRWFLIAAFVIGLIFWLLWRQKRQLSDEQRDSFAELLSDGLAARQARNNAV